MMPRIRRLESSSSAEPEGDVDAFLHDVDIVVGEPQPHLDVGIAVAEFGNARGDQPAAEAERRGDADRAARLAGQRADGGLRLGDRLQHLLGAGVEHRALLGRHQLPRRAVEQPHAEMLFQFLDAVGGDGRRDAHVAAGGRQIAEFDDADEDGDVVEIGHARGHAFRRSMAIASHYFPDFFESHRASSALSV